MLNMHSVALTCKMVCRNSWIQGLLMIYILFARNAHEALFLLENLMHEFAEVGLLLNAFVDTDGYQIASEKRVWCTQMYLDASSVWGRVEG